jgi:hypothetical protein
MEDGVFEAGGNFRARKRVFIEYLLTLSSLYCAEYALENATAEIDV